VMLGAAVAAVLVAAGAWAAPMERFFIMGDGRLALVNAHTDERVDVRFRRADGSYDEAALARVRRAFRSAGDDGDGKASLRLIEVLSALQQRTKVRPLVLVSGYRSPEYNEKLRGQGVRAAGGSLHTEGLAADVAFPRPMLHGLWFKLRAMDCCGAGYYAKEGFIHVDVGRPRFWEPQTSRVEENLSAGNARLFARTEYDRYAVGEEIGVTLHALTVPPVWIAREARLVGGGREVGVRMRDEQRDCVNIDDAGRGISFAGLDGTGRRRFVLATCEPRPGQTPVTVDGNLIEIR